MIAENWAISTDAQLERMKEGEYPPPAPNGSTNAEASRRSMLTTGFERLRAYYQGSVSFRGLLAHLRGNVHIKVEAKVDPSNHRMRLLIS